MKRKRLATRCIACILSVFLVLVSVLSLGDNSAKAEGTDGEYTVYFLNSENYTAVNAYVWEPAEDLGAWPGSACSEAAEMGSGWYKVNVFSRPSSKPFNVIFNDGNGKQVTSYIGDDEHNFVTADGNNYTSKADAQKAAFNTVYFYGGSQFENVNVYAWGNYGEVFGGWPGTAMESASSLGNGWWSVSLGGNVDWTNWGINLIFTSDDGDRSEVYSELPNVYTAYDQKAYSSLNAANEALNLNDGSGESGDNGSENGTGNENETGNDNNEPDTEPVKVHFINSENWENVYCYTYANGGDLGASWPGVLLSPDDNTAYDVRNIDVDASAFGLILHNNGDKRVETYISGTSQVYVLGNGGMFGSLNEALVAAGYGSADDYTNVYFYNNHSWDVINGYVYVNDQTLGAGWPGTRLVAADDLEDNTNWYKLVIPKVGTEESTVNVIFNNGAEQLPDVKIGRPGNVYVIGNGQAFDTVSDALSAAAEDVYDDGCEEGENADLTDLDLTAPGAGENFIRYEGEDAVTNGEVLPFGNTYSTMIQSEASKRSAVVLESGEYVEFALTDAANSVVLRYSIPDSADGAGQLSNAKVYADGEFVSDVALSSEYSWIYGGYPYTNNPSEGRPHRFFDDSAVLFDRVINAGSTVRIVNDGTVPLTLDFVETENVGPSIAQPENSISVTDFGAVAGDGTDDYESFKAAIASAKENGKILYVPAGVYDLVEKKALEVSGVEIQGAGMWYTTLKGEGAAFKYSGTSKFRDFALKGISKVRNDSGDLAGFEGSGKSKNVTIENIWMEHIKVGVWSYSSDGLLIQGCRIRNTYADGINLCSQTTNSTVRNNSIRNTGDDGIAIWPWLADSYNNTIEHNTVELPTLANAIAVYGGYGNKVLNNVVRDIINNGSGICIGSDYETPAGFTGTTTVSGNVSYRAGSYHTDYSYPIGAIWIWSTKSPMIADFDISDNDLYDCSYEGILFDTFNDISGVRLKDNTVHNLATDGIFVRGGSKTGSASVENFVCDTLSGEVINNTIPELFTFTFITSSDETGENGESDETNETYETDTESGKTDSGNSGNSGKDKDNSSNENNGKAGGNNGNSNGNNGNHYGNANGNNGNGNKNSDTDNTVKNNGNGRGNAFGRKTVTYTFTASDLNEDSQEAADSSEILDEEVSLSDSISSETTDKEDSDDKVTDSDLAENADAENIAEEELPASGVVESNSGVSTIAVIIIACAIVFILAAGGYVLSKKKISK
ncbi:MAG: starch-binding protein [Acetatifactor sp.]|nr:starch-binding protein [Acetatifactor sp.]